METAHEWLWGWDPTPGIVSVWAGADGRAWVWRRSPQSGALTLEPARFRPWVLVSTLDFFAHLPQAPTPEEAPGTQASAMPPGLRYRELQGAGALRCIVSADDGRLLADALLEGASRRYGQRVSHLRELKGSVLALSPEEQYLVATGRTYFKDLRFDQLRRAQLDLETTGLDPEVDRVFLIAVRAPDGTASTLETKAGDERALILQLNAWLRACDPDVVENHNLHGFDLPFLARRAELLRVPLQLGRFDVGSPRRRPSARGASFPGSDGKGARFRYSFPGRELIDTLDAVRRHDFSARDLPGHGLKEVARHFGLAREQRELIPGHAVHATYVTDPERVRRYATDDVTEVAGLAALLGGAAFALARMAPRRYETLADAGAATGVIDPLLVRAYLRSGQALPVHEASDGTTHQGAALHLFATGVAHRVVKADVASLYPSLMCQYRIGPSRDRLGVLVTLVEQLVEQRLHAKATAKHLPPGSPERHTLEALSAAMKLVVNSAYGYLGALGLTRFADIHAANEVTRHGREVLRVMCTQLEARGVTLLEADTDGVYFAAPEGWGEREEREAVAQVAALLPPRVRLEYEGRSAAMLSHEPKNYALLGYDGKLLLRGVAFRSSRAEAFGEAFLRRALKALLEGDVARVREIYVDVVTRLRQRALPTAEISSAVRLTKSPAQYRALRPERVELPYEAALASGRTEWAPGERLRVYRATGGAPRVLDERAGTDPRDYDVEHYVELLKGSFAARLQRALLAEDFSAVFEDPSQLSLFTRDLARARPILTVLPRGQAQDGPADNPPPG